LAIRATARLLEVDKDTVCDWLPGLGQHCARVMVYHFRHLHLTRVGSVRTDYAACGARAQKNVISQMTDYVLGCVFRQPAQTWQIERKTRCISPRSTHQDWIAV
jgi:hypothetical protein